MKFPAWGDFNKALTDLQAALRNFQERPITSEKIDPATILELLPQPLNFVAEAIFRSASGSEEEKLQTVLDYFKGIENHGEEQYNRIIWDLESVTILLTPLDMTPKVSDLLAVNLRQILNLKGEWAELGVQMLGIKIRRELLESKKADAGTTVNTSAGAHFRNWGYVIAGLEEPTTTASPIEGQVWARTKPTDLRPTSKSSNRSSYNKQSNRASVDYAPEPSGPFMINGPSSPVEPAQVKAGRVTAGKSASLNLSPPEVSREDNSPSPSIAISQGAVAERVAAKRSAEAAPEEAIRPINSRSGSEVEVVPKTLNVSRYPYAIFPSNIRVGEEKALEVLIRAFKPAIGGKPGQSEATGSINVKTDGTNQFEDILVIIDYDSIKENFVIPDRLEGTIRVPVQDVADSASVFFKLTAKKVGECVIRLSLIQRSMLLDELQIRAAVTTESTAEVKNAVYRGSEVDVAPSVNLPDSKLLGLILVKLDEGNRRYKVLIQRGNEVASEPVEEPIITLSKEPEPIFREYFGFIEESDQDVWLREDQLKDIGRSLYDDIFPYWFREYFWDIKDEIGHIHVISNETWIPWEIIRPYNGDKELKCLCEQYEFSRWLNVPAQGPKRRKPITSKTVRRAALFIPTSKREELQSLNDEFRWMTTDFGPSHDVAVSPISSYSEAISLFKSGNCDLIHVTAHGQHNVNSPALSKIELEGGSLNVGSIKGENSKFGNENPLIFLNSCQSARQNIGVSRIQSWIQGFIQAGACGFIGTLWSVPADSATKFARRFYENLATRNTTVAEALHITRRDLRDEGDPTWLAYVYYGHPNLSIGLGER